MIKKNYSELFELTDAQIARLRKEYMPFKGKTLPVGMNRKIDGMLDRLSTQQLVKLANTDIPVIATAAKGVAVMKRGMKYKDFKQGLDMGEADELQCEACWSGYKQVGLKKKGDRMVPNCVPESKELLDMQEADLSKRQVKMVHKAADKLDKKDFMKRYGKDGDSVRYATATNMVKKKLGIDEQRALSSPEVAATLRQFIAQRPFIDNKKDYEELMRLAAKDMGMFNARLNRMTDQTKEKVKSALQRKGLTSHLTNEKEPKGDKPMQEQSYKDKFNATMKDFGIKSLGDLKSDEEKKKFFKAVDAKHDAKNEMEEAMNTAMDGGTSMPDMNLKAMKMNAMKMSEPMKKMDDKETENPKKDADMSKVKDKQVMLKAMMKKEAEVPAEPMGKLKTGEKMKNEEAEPLTRPTMSLKDKMKINAMKMPIRSMKMNAMKNMNAMKMEMMKEMMEMMKKEMMKEMDDMPEMMKKEMMKEMKNMAEMKMKSEMKKMEMMKAERDPAKMEMMKSEMMKEMMKEMKMEMMKKMKEMMKEYGSMNAMKKPMNAMAMKKESNKYLDTKAGSIQDIARQMFEKEHQIVEVKENDIEKMIADYLKKGGTITKLPPALAKGMKPSDMQKYKVGDKGVIKSMKMKEVRDFVETYNKHFLTNWAAEELMLERRFEVTEYFFSDLGGQVGLTVVVDAVNEDQAAKKAEPKIEKLRNSSLANKMRVDDPTGDLADVDPTTRPLNYTDIDKDMRP